ncbi:MAG: hypothetical protein HQL08_02970, partial [Nitrospirae bacterium]|nr:hypothetical protein [Nitrospirota bacterium]
MIKIKSTRFMQILCKLLPAAVFVTLLVLSLNALPNRAMAAEKSESYAAEGDSEKSRQETIPIDVQLQLDAHIKSYIDSYEATYCTAAVTDSDCRGKEYKDTRRFCVGDIDGDGCDDIAVLYTIEGFCCGNNYSFYVAVFLNKGHKYEFATSEK